MSKGNLYCRNESVVITAFGAVTPLGGSYNEINKSLLGGISGIKEVRKFNCESFITKHAGLPDEGNETIRWPGRNARVIETFYAETAAKRLLMHPNFPKSKYSDERIGCIIGVDEPAVDIQLCLNMKAGSDKDSTKISLFKKMIQHFRLNDCLNLEPSSILNSIFNIIPFKGYSNTHVGLCSASLQAIGMGVNALRQGNVDAIIVGGVSGKVNPINLARLELMDVISTDSNLLPNQRSRPFEEKRSGFILAEGAILFLLEKENILNKEKRGLIEILGYGSSLGAQHIVIPHKDSMEMRLSMQRALIDASLNSTQIDLINAHGTSTILNDLHEALAINEIFRDNSNILVTANKSLHGHLIASAGAMEVLNTLISMNEGYVPGVINLDKQDKECKINVINKSRFINIKTVLKNSFGMGGLAASMVLSKVS